MLKRLHVRNLALAENVQVEFEPGLNTVTGETGAGKSILLGALALLLGERADRSMIRTGEDVCSAEALFELEDPRDVDRLLDEHGLPPCEDGQLVIRRVFRASSNASQNLVNDAPVTLQMLKRLGERLVDMHGPHDHQSLFHTSAQMDMLDAFGQLGRERAAYEQEYAALHELRARRDELLAAGDDVEDRLDRLRYKIKEIEDTAPVDGEEEEIRAEHLRVGNAQRILELANAVLNHLTENEESAFNGVAAVHRPLDELARLLPAGEVWKKDAEEIGVRLQELAANVRREVDAIDANPERLEWLDQRLAAYARLRRKYGATVTEILDALERARLERSELENRAERLVALEKDLAAGLAAVKKSGGALGRKRRTAAEELSEAVTGELEFLGFPDSAFRIELAAVEEPRPDGLDAVEFGFAPNPGEAMRPLRQIASSGEISRVMLALKAVLAVQDRIPLLVFDEIDANLGGAMGDAVGRELAGVAERHQVVCITHLPQVAVYGTTHWAVSKDVREGRTYSTVARLEGEARVAEITRMLGSQPGMSTGRDHAAALLKHARTARR